MEKMLVAQALDERDLLKKKINDKISKLQLVDFKKKNNEKTGMTMMDSDMFTTMAQAAYQQVKDLIDRYMRLNAAIITSNAETFVETPWGEMSVANAISIRSRLKNALITSRIMENADDLFEIKLMAMLKKQYDAAVQAASRENARLADQAEGMRNSILGNEQKAADSKVSMELVDLFVKENTAELLDPVCAMEKMQQWKDYVDNFLSEIETRIKVSNATKTIEF